MKKVLVLIMLLLYMTFPMTVNAKDIYAPVEEVDPKEKVTYLDNYIPSNAWIYVVAVVGGIVAVVVICEKRKK